MLAAWHHATLWYAPLALGALPVLAIPASRSSLPLAGWVLPAAAGVFIAEIARNMLPCPDNPRGSRLLRVAAEMLLWPASCAAVIRSLVRGRKSRNMPRMKPRAGSGLGWPLTALLVAEAVWLVAGLASQLPLETRLIASAVAAPALLGIAVLLFEQTTSLTDQLGSRTREAGTAMRPRDSDHRQ